MNGKTAIIIGASMTGLLAARVLSKTFDHVTVIERDELPDSPELRNGVPQGRHIHALLARGQDILEHYFPGLSDELTQSGSPQMTWCKDTCYYTVGGWIKRFDSGIVTNVITRPDLEWRVRRRVQAVGNVTFKTGYDVRNLTASPDKQTITGVEIERRGDKSTETLQADLVVDASGRGSKAPEWLTALGYDAPPETQVNAHIGYATRVYEKPASFKDNWRVLFILARPTEGNKRGAGLFDIGNNQWMVTLGGMNKDYPPTDDAAFLEYAKTVASLTLYELIKDAKPLTPIYGYRIVGSRLRHFEKLTRRPENFIAMGDAVCAFNPLYGQGMTTGAIGAEVLDQLMTGWRKNHTDLNGFAGAFHKKLAKAVQNAWLVSTGEDLRYEGTEGDRPGAFARLTQVYIDQYLRVAQVDETLTRAFIEVNNLTAAPTSLFAPHIFARVIARSAQRMIQNRTRTSRPVYEIGEIIPAAQ